MIPAETDIEALARTVNCPVCGAQPGRRCWYGTLLFGGTTWQYSHTGRRLKAEGKASLDHTHEPEPEQP